MRKLLPSCPVGLGGLRSSGRMANWRRDLRKVWADRQLACWTRSGEGNGGLEWMAAFRVST